MAPSTKQLSQKEYLKKYLNKKKKKKPRRTGRRGNVKMIDDDAINRIEDNAFEDFENAEDAPVIAGYYDERPTEVKLLENYRNANRWQPLPGVDKENNGGRLSPSVKTQKSRLARDCHYSPTSSRRERHDEDSRGRKRKHQSSHAASPPRSKHRQEMSPPPSRRTPPRTERRLEERSGYSPSRRGDRSKFEEHRQYPELGQRFRDNEHSPRRMNSSRYNGGGAGDRHYRQEDLLFEERYVRSRQRQRSVDRDSPIYRNQRMDDEFRGSVRRSDPRLSPFDERERDRDRFERPLSPLARRNERADERRHADEGRRELASGDHRMQSSRNQRSRRYSDIESPPPLPQSKHRLVNRGDEHLSSRIGTSQRHNASPSRGDRRLSPPRTEHRLSPPRNDRDRRPSPRRNERRMSPPRNDRQLSPSPPRENLEEHPWRRSFSPAPSRRFHSPAPTLDSRRAERRDDRSPARGSRSRNERPASPPVHFQKDNHRVDNDMSLSSHRRKDYSRDDRHPRDRRREAKESQDVRNVSMEQSVVQDTRGCREQRETIREARHHREEAARDAREHRRDANEGREVVRTIVWKEKSTAVSRSVPAKCGADSSPLPSRRESPRRHDPPSPYYSKRKEKIAGASSSFKKTDEAHRGGGDPPPSKHRTGRHHESPASSSPKHRSIRYEPPPPSLASPRYRDESKQRGHSHKHGSVDRGQRGRDHRTSDDLNDVAANAAKNYDSAEKRFGENATSKGAKKRDRGDRDHKKSEKSSRHKDEQFGLLSTKKPSIKPEEKLSDEQAGKNAATIYRDAKTGKKRDLQAEKLEKIEKRRKEDAKKEKYYQWGRGLKQVNEEKEKIEAEQYEMSKPLARYADDNDLDETLKQKEVDLDPMLEYIRRKKRKKDVKEGKVTKPAYKGSWPPNRFNIPPGHKWDGVDRSNGYENRYFAKQSEKKAMEEEAHKWCSEDM